MLRNSPPAPAPLSRAQRVPGMPTAPPAGNVRHRERTGAVAEMNAVGSAAGAIRVSPERWPEMIYANLTGGVHPVRATPRP
jgi:hypothetical protein